MYSVWFYSFCIASENKFSTSEFNTICYFEITSKFYTPTSRSTGAFGARGGQGPFRGGHGVPTLPRPRGHNAGHVRRKFCQLDLCNYVALHDLFVFSFTAKVGPTEDVLLSI